jgi:hypothetical protein
MAGFIEGADRGQLSLLPGSLDDWVGNDNPVRVIDAFVDKLDLNKLGFGTVEALDLGRPGYHPCVHLKLYIERPIRPEAGRVSAVSHSPVSPSLATEPREVDSDQMLKFVG